MADDKLQQLLQYADKSAGQPQYKAVSLEFIVRRRTHRRRIKMIAGPIAAVVLILTGLSIYTITRNVTPKPLTPQQVASLKAQINDLNARLDSTLKLVEEITARERAQEKLDQLNAELASIPDPMEELNKKIEKTAFILLYYADKGYEEFHNADDAELSYNRVIELFPQTLSARLAKERLEKIREILVNKEKLNI